MLVGAGGTGSVMAVKLVKLHAALIALGHPGGLDVTIYDGDTVSQSNVGRQNFYPSDVGQNKAVVMAHRINMAYGTRWKAVPDMFDGPDGSRRNPSIVIGAVDSRKARKLIVETFLAAYYSPYYLDMGNRAHDGQVVLGQLGRGAYFGNDIRLPHAADLFPEIIRADDDAADTAPSCSLADALEKQSLTINEMVATAGWNILWRLLRYGEIDHHGAFVNLESGRVVPIPIDTEVWKSMGYKFRRKPVRKSAQPAG
jgi:PRTRC genetic system ThiF family protein